MPYHRFINGLRGSHYLLKDMNWALATLEVVQDMTGRREDMVLRSATGLEGGLVACGSTCGVVTGGVLGIALVRMKEADGEEELLQRAVMSEAREYVGWFQENFKTTLCRERTSADFYKAEGQLRYFLPDRVGRCLWHTGKASICLENMSTKALAVSNENTASRNSESVHCAVRVLEGVRKSCGVGDVLLERIAFVLDGGVALSGGVCGAMAGAVMAANLVFGWDIRRMNYAKTIREFIRGHVNLLRRHPSRKPETFTIGRDIMNYMRSKQTMLECSRITGRTFPDWDDFQAYIRSSTQCHDLIEEAITAASQAITRRRPL